METAILILQYSLMQQREQLNLAEKRQNDYKNDKQKLMIMKAVNNLKGFIADIENAIKELERAQEDRYASVPQANELLPHVSQQREQLINFLTWHDSENLGCLPDGIEGRVDEYIKILQYSIGEIKELPYENK